ncbi:B-cell antigen receptor complex-associated protein beta chain [Lampris incognitus]|uniref:B-cell antigen receptor complex-associated protein beta chain n=1 Tax=Lampris incognitus TaxID=2546036 RepID=UPI0024B5503B|nr:B-cell antigen receptor complex-associated protein beta chain [Lampris incognitus]
MHWLPFGCCGLALISLSVALNQTPGVHQWPRFYGVKTNHRMRINCMYPDPYLQAKVEWYKASEYDVATANRSQVFDGARVTITKHTMGATIFIEQLTTEDSGVYYCKKNNTWGAGTGLQVNRPINIANAVYRSKMKDGLILFQGLLLAICIAAPLLHNYKLRKKEEAVYEEAQTDHIYEGLEIETCGGGDLYEDVSVYTQPGGAEAPWETN